MHKCLSTERSSHFHVETESNDWFSLPYSSPLCSCTLSDTYTTSVCVIQMNCMFSCFWILLVIFSHLGIVSLL